MICYKGIIKQVRGFDDISSKTEVIANDLGIQILRKHGYNPYVPVQFENRFSDIFDYGTDFGIDHMIYTWQIPANDPLKFKQVKPFNKDNDYYSIDYKAHQFRDNEINIMLMKVRYPSFYTLKSYFNRVEKGLGEQYRFQSLLAKEKQTDFFLLVKRTTEKYYPDKAPNCLVNAYLIPATSLKDLIYNNLNFIRENNDLSALNHGESDLKKQFGIHETWQIYRKIDNKIKRTYPFHLEKRKDNRPNQYQSLMMKIPEEHLSNYIKFNENGEIVKRNGKVVKKRN